MKMSQINKMSKARLARRWRSAHKRAVRAMERAVHVREGVEVLVMDHRWVEAERALHAAWKIRCVLVTP